MRKANGIGFIESRVIQFAGGDFELPQGDFSSDVLADLLRSWATEIDSWVTEDNQPVKVSVSFAKTNFTPLLCCLIEPTIHIGVE